MFNDAIFKYLLMQDLLFFASMKKKLDKVSKNESITHDISSNHHRHFVIKLMSLLYQRVTKNQHVSSVLQCYHLLLTTSATQLAHSITQYLQNGVEKARIA